MQTLLKALTMPLTTASTANDYIFYSHTRLTALFPGLPGWVGTRKVKLIWILLKQETVSGNGISRAICKSASRSRQITTPAPHHSVFLQAGCPSCRPTNSVKALRAIDYIFYCAQESTLTANNAVYLFDCSASS